ncbi:MAG: hypothetical protein FJ039_06840 [Chloroflexi bacterium]|nr:hypothetical protein [Chloroflexota bacterium]
MATKQRTRKATGNRMPLSKADLEIMRRETDAAIASLAHYGEPKVDIQELRRHLKHELKGISLSEFLLKEREASR